MINHRTAQRIASEWHAGGGSALYVFASTGAIQQDPDTYHNRTARDVESEIDIQHMEIGGDTRELTHLLTYITHYGPRPAVPGWYDQTIARS